MTIPWGDSGPVRTGIVTNFNAAKGFGFIKQEDGTEIFAHRNDTADKQDLVVGESVCYEEGIDVLKGSKRCELRSEMFILGIILERS